MTTPHFTGTGALSAGAVVHGVGPQLSRAAEGRDPRGQLVFAFLPDNLQRAEDSTQAADKDRSFIRRQGRGFERDATPTERQLLSHLGYTLPAELKTFVKWPTAGVRHRSWPQIEDQEIAP
jgi:hypothetical protein